jgi:hypothetical protein
MVEKIKDIRDTVIPKKEEAAQFEIKLKIAKDLSNNSNHLTTNLAYKLLDQEKCEFVCTGFAPNKSGNVEPPEYIYSTVYPVTGFKDLAFNNNKNVGMVTIPNRFVFPNWKS